MLMVVCAVSCFELAVTVTIAAQNNLRPAESASEKPYNCGICSRQSLGDFPFFGSFLLIVLLILQYR